jgi:hypothetical protein
MSTWYDEAVARAASCAANVEIHSIPRKRPERALTEAFRDGLSIESRFSGFAFEQKHGLSNFTRPPGKIDLVAEIDLVHALLFEMKVDHPDETIWDAIKLAQTQAGGKCHGIASAYLVVWATEASWKTKQATGLFERPSRSWGVKEMIEKWPRAWEDLRRGGNGIVPEHSVGAVGFEPIGQSTKAVSAKYDAIIKVARVWPASLKRQDFDSEGWPVGMEKPSYSRSLKKISERASVPRVKGRRSPCHGSPIGKPDPLHGYTWLPRWDQKILEAVVPVLDDLARACLRSRLRAERAWTDGELVERFDPIPSNFPPQGG